MTANAFRMNRFTLRFSDADLERKFSDDIARKALKPFRMGVLSAIGVVLLIWLLLANLLPEVPDARTTLYWPMMGLLAIMSIGFLRSFLPNFAVRYQFFILLGAMTGAADLIWMLSHLTRASLGAITIMLVVHTFNVYTILRLRFTWACCAGWGMTAMFLAYLGYSDAWVGIDLAGEASLLFITNLFGMIAAHQIEVSARREFLALRDVAVERERSDQLLHNILPVEVARELLATGVARPARHDSATILFTDFSGFTQVASAMPADRMVAELNEIFGTFDDICDELGVEKIKTIGDAYMAAAGIPKPCADHAQRCVQAGLRMQEYLEQKNRTGSFKWNLRVGVHSGPVVSGVVGKRKYAFDVWGDSVNIASRLESAGEVRRVNISAYTYDLIRNDYDCEYRGKVTAKGKGEIDMYFVDGPRAATKETRGA